MAKTRRKRLKQFAILDASIYFACFPESHNFGHNMTMRAAITTVNRRRKRFLPRRPVPGYGRRPARMVTLFAPESFGARNTWMLNGKNSGFALKQFAILDASMYFACFPESHNSAHNMTMRAVYRTMKPQEMPRNAEVGLFTM